MRSGVMNEFLKNYTLKIGEKNETAFLRRCGIAQDGTTPMCRDTDGKLWAISGHSHVGHIGVFSGTCVGDLAEVWQAQTNFCVGHADFAFDKVRYPDRHTQQNTHRLPKRTQIGGKLCSTVEVRNIRFSGGKRAIRFLLPRER